MSEVCSGEQTFAQLRTGLKPNEGPTTHRTTHIGCVTAVFMVSEQVAGGGGGDWGERGGYKGGPQTQDKGIHCANGERSTCSDVTHT